MKKAKIVCICILAIAILTISLALKHKPFQYNMFYAYGSFQFPTGIIATGCVVPVASKLTTDPAGTLTNLASHQFTTSNFTACTCLVTTAFSE